MEHCNWNIESWKPVHFVVDALLILHKPDMGFRLRIIYSSKGASLQAYTGPDNCEVGRFRRKLVTHMPFACSLDTALPRPDVFWRRGHVNQVFEHG